MRYLNLILLLILFTFATVQTLSAQDSSGDALATIYFYRVASIKGAAIGFNLHHEDSVIGRITSGSSIVYRCRPGVQEFWAQTESRRSVFIEAAPGGTYFVHCTISMGAVAGVPSFRQVSAQDAVPHITQILQQVANSGETISELEKLRGSIAKPEEKDTVRAMNNLFERKRKGGTTRAVIFGILGVTAMVQAAQGEPTAWAGVGLFGAVAVTGITQTAKYNSEKLQKLLTDYKNGIPLQGGIKKKFKKKDFEW
ncbi:MAG TPA: hypothetical protein VFW11_17400 [Cyclobacteriaceae bacterium]|nr:hypothetical protein [Cyclobacteriaceae bacterium]